MFKEIKNYIMGDKMFLNPFSHSIISIKILNAFNKFLN